MEINDFVLEELDLSDDYDENVGESIPEGDSVSGEPVSDTERETHHEDAAENGPVSEEPVSDTEAGTRCEDAAENVSVSEETASENGNTQTEDKQIIADDTENMTDSSIEEGKPKKRSVVLPVLVLLLIAAVLFFYVRGYMTYGSHFFPNTFVSGTDVSELTADEARAVLKQHNLIESIDISGREGVKESLPIPNADAYKKYQGIEELIKGQQNELWFLHQKDVKSYEPSFEIAFSAEGLREDLEKSELLSENAARKPVDAAVEYDENEDRYFVRKEDNGTTLDFEKALSSVSDSLKKYPETADLSAAGCYINASQGVTEQMKKEALILNHYTKAGITLDMGAETSESIDGRTFLEYIGGDDFVSNALENNENPAVNEDKLHAFVEGLAVKYNTKKEDILHPFKDHKGVTRWIDTDYGWELDQEKTFELLKNTMEKLADGKRQHALLDYYPQVSAVWKSKAASHGRYDYGTKYIEADLSEQHVYLFDNGELLWESDCVSGLYAAAGRRTPEDIDGIDGKFRNKVLRGYNRDGSISYESPVTYWMPFRGGIGLHDASWRYKFGGKIYIYSGSHGCINLPRAKAKELFDLAEVDMAVITYY